MSVNVITLKEKSQFVCGGVQAELLLPSGENRPKRLLTLLHGAAETPETILNNFDLLKASERLHLAILLPALGNSFYLDWGEGKNARSSLLLEMLPAARTYSGISANRRYNAVGGISMGGFGALSLALSEPARFSAAFSLSGALDLQKAAQLFRICELPPPGDLCTAALRPETKWDALLSQKTAKPNLYLAWGDRDWFREANRSFIRQAAECGMAVKASETPGLHDWAYWQSSLGPALEWTVP